MLHNLVNKDFQVSGWDFRVENDTGRVMESRKSHFQFVSLVYYPHV